MQFKIKYQRDDIQKTAAEILNESLNAPTIKPVSAYDAQKAKVANAWKGNSNNSTVDSNLSPNELNKIKMANAWKGK
ncbi:hypothetical protein FZI56_21480 [Cronobacter sakazakii]|nr:hypothetical protein FZI56_21480 [Cronobacter sakazakii]